MNNESAATEIVIFGGAGDLSWRKLLPALYMADAHDRLDGQCRIIGVGRHAWSADEYRDFVTQKARPCIETQALSEAAWRRFVQRLDWVALDASQAEGYGRLRESCRLGAQKVFYLATAPSLFAGIAQHLHGAGLIDTQARVVLEKPLGHDLASARAINEVFDLILDERRAELESIETTRKQLEGARK